MDAQIPRTEATSSTAGPRAALESRTAFDEFQRRATQRIYSYILNRIRRPHETAEDLTQETFVKAWVHWSTFDANRDGLAWILQIAQNVVNDHFKSIRAQKRQAIPAHAANFGDRLAVGPTIDGAARSAPAPDEQLLIAERELALDAAIERIDPLKREVIMLRRAGLSYDEIAARTEQTAGSVGSILSRTVKELAAMLSKHID